MKIAKLIKFVVLLSSTFIILSLSSCTKTSYTFTNNFCYEDDPTAEVDINNILNSGYANIIFTIYEYDKNNQCVYKNEIIYDSDNYRKPEKYIAHKKSKYLKLSLTMDCKLLDYHYTAWVDQIYFLKRGQTIPIIFEQYLPETDIEPIFRY